MRIGHCPVLGGVSQLTLRLSGRKEGSEDLQCRLNEANRERVSERAKTPLIKWDADNYTRVPRGQLPAGFTLRPTVQTGPSEDGGGGALLGKPRQRTRMTADARARTRARWGHPGLGRRQLFGKVQERERELVWRHAEAPGPSPTAVSDGKRKERGWTSSREEPTSGFEEACGRAEESMCLRDGRFSQDSTDRGSRQLRPWRHGCRGTGRLCPGAGVGTHVPAWPHLPRTRLLLGGRPCTRHPFAERAPAPSAHPASSRAGRKQPERERSGQRAWSRAPSAPKPPSLSSCHCSLGAFRARRESPDPHPSRRGAGWLTVQPLLPESGRGRGVSACLATKRPGNTDAPQGTL